MLSLDTAARLSTICTLLFISNMLLYLAGLAMMPDVLIFCSRLANVVLILV